MNKFPTPPWLSVCIAVGPAETVQPLFATLNSIARQTECDVEIVVKATGKHLAREIREYLRNGGIRGATLSLLTGADSGTYDAFNRCARAARGQYILFLGCGDLLALPDVASALKLHAASKGNPDVIYGVVFLRGEKGTRDSAFDNGCFFGRRARLPWRNPCHSQGLAYKRAWFDRRPFRIDIGPLADLVHTHRYRLYELANWIDQPICVFMLGGASTRLSFRALRARLRGISANCGAFRFSVFWRVVSCTVFVLKFILDASKSLTRTRSYDA